MASLVIIIIQVGIDNLVLMCAINKIIAVFVVILWFIKACLPVIVEEIFFD